MTFLLLKAAKHQTVLLSRAHQELQRIDRSSALSLLHSADVHSERQIAHYPRETDGYPSDDLSLFFRQPGHNVREYIGVVHVVSCCGGGRLVGYSPCPVGWTTVSGTLLGGDLSLAEQAHPPVTR